MDGVKQEKYKSSMMGAKAPGHSSLWQVPLAAVITIVRMVTLAPSRLWRDWIVVLCAYWIFTVLKGESPAAPIVTVTVMAYLFGIHVLGQLPHVLTVLGLGA
jgi:hypothetical protein